MRRYLRSPREIGFRLRQEIVNAKGYVFRPVLPADVHGPPSPLPGLPDPGIISAAVRETPYAAELICLAEAILSHRFPILGIEVATGPDIRWRRDYVNHIETEPRYFRKVPYLDAARAGDHKIVWELNRHQHLVVLAQAYCVSGSRKYLNEIERQIASWREQNPYLCGMNWTSALEVAFRALSWIWVFHLAGAALSAECRGTLLEGLFLHGSHLRNNLSVYFSPNTHLLGESIVLHAIGALFPQFPESANWVRFADAVVQDQMVRQVRPDGGHFEQSTYYHVYATDMFLFHALLSHPSEAYRSKLRRMVDYLVAILGPCKTNPFIGDDDGGRFFHPYSPQREYGRSTLAACGAYFQTPEWISPNDYLEQAVWWFGPKSAAAHAATPATSHLFKHTGLAVMSAPGMQVLVDVGPFGPWSSGHSHADTLSLVVRTQTEELLIDAGTYTYVGDSHARDLFRGTAAHNTLRINGLDQANPRGPFGWTEQPAVQVLQWRSGTESDFVDAECCYRGFTHRRRVLLVKSAGVVLVTDDVSGPPGDCEIEQFWHPGVALANGQLDLEEPQEVVEGWRSRAFGVKEPSPGIRVSKSGPLPLRLRARIRVHPQGDASYDDWPELT